MLHITPTTPLTASLQHRDSAQQAPAPKTDVDFAGVLRAEQVKDLRGAPPHNNLTLLEARLTEAEAPGDLRRAIADFVTPPPEGGKEAFLAMMDRLHGSAHPLSIQLDALQEARTALTRFVGSYTADTASEARAVLAELSAQIEALRTQIQDDAMQRVEGKNAPRV